MVEGVKQTRQLVIMAKDQSQKGVSTTSLTAKLLTPKQQNIELVAGMYGLYCRQEDYHKQLKK